MNRVFFFLQGFLKYLLIFCLVFIWARFAMRSLWAAISLSVAITVVIGIVLRFFLSRSQRKQKLKLKEQDDAENMFLSLATTQNYLEFYKKLALIKHSQVEKKKGCIVYNDGEKYVIYPILKFEELREDDLVKILKEKECLDAKKIIIPCHSYNKNIMLFASNFEQEIKLLDRFECYSSLYKPLNTYPQITKSYKKSKKLAFKGLVAYSFSKQRAKGYFFAAIILLLSSMFIKVSLYYCIMASLLLIFAFVSYFGLFMTQEEPKKEII